MKSSPTFKKTNPKNPMNKYAHIINKLEVELEEIKLSNEDLLIITEKSIKAIQTSLLKLKKITQNSKFDKQADEIIFFKSIKPTIVAKLIYQVKLFNIESKYIAGTKNSQIDYLEKSIIKLQEYFNDNQEIYIYFRRSDTHLDHHYFLVKNKNLRIHPDNLLSISDESFATTHDTTYANFIANTMLIKYLKGEIDNIQKNKNEEIVPEINIHSSNLFWTGNKVDLVELIYALHASKVINRGKVGIKEIAAVFETIFNIDIGGFYRIYLEIRLRKTNKTKFLDVLKTKFLKRMNQSDI